MQKQSATILLRQLIREKELERNNDRIILNGYFQIISNSINPIAIISGLVKRLFFQPTIKQQLTTAGLSLLTGFISQKLANRD